MIGSYLKMVPGYPIEPVLVGYQTAAVASNTVLTITKPSGTKAGYLLLAFVVHSSSSDGYTPPSGWTEIVYNFATCDFTVCWKVAGASEAANYSFTADSSGNQSGVIVLFRGCDPVSPIVDYGTVSRGSPIIVPGVTAGANNVLLTFVCHDGSTYPDGSTMTWGTPAGMEVLAYDTDGTSPEWSLFSKEVDAGATGDITVTGGGAGVNIAVGPVS